jgi:valyl-tRNA synthetase
LGADVLDAAGITREVVAYVDAKHELVRIGRQMRADYGVAPGKWIDYLIRPAGEDAAAMLEADRDALAAALRAGNLAIDVGLAPDEAMPSGISELGTIFLPVDDLIDVEAELKRLNDELAKINGFLENAAKKLSNDNFVSRAPEDVVEKVRANRRDLMEKAEKVKSQIAALGA